MKASMSVLSSLLLLTSMAATAEERHLGPHVHGQASVNVSIDAREMDVAASLPGHDAVGFEHPPGSPAEQAAVDKAIATLNQPTWFVVPAAAHCTLASAKVSPHGFGGAAEPGGHADFDATYHYTCNTPGQLDHLDVRLASVFPSVQKVVVNLITAAGSNQQTLDGTTTRVDIQQ